MADAAAELVAAHADLEMTQTGKCRCKVTGHEMVPQRGVIEAHLAGKRYRKMKAQEAAAQYDFAQHEPHIVQNKRDPKKLFCHRTKLHLNRVPEEVEVHVKGRRFRARLQEWEEKQKRRAAKAAKTQQKADVRAAAKVDRQRAGSDEDEDPVLAKFAHLAGDDSEDEDDDDASSDDDEVPEWNGKQPRRKAKAHESDGSNDETPYADSDAEGEEEMDHARAAKEHYNRGRLAAQAQAQQHAPAAEADEDQAGSDFEVVAGEYSSSGGDAASDSEDAAESSGEGADSEDAEQLTAAKKLSMARHAARKERDAASNGEPHKSGSAGACEPSGSEDGPAVVGAVTSSSSSDSTAGAGVWHHGVQVSKHHGRSKDKRHVSKKHVFNRNKHGGNQGVDAKGSAGKKRAYDGRRDGSAGGKKKKSGGIGRFFSGNK